MSVDVGEGKMSSLLFPCSAWWRSVSGSLSRCSVSSGGLSCISLPSIIIEFPFMFAFVPFSLPDPILSCSLFPVTVNT